MTCKVAGSLSFQKGKRNLRGGNWKGEATALNMFPMRLPRQFVAWEGEAPAQP